ncbi:hypothetical protein EDEG_01998 [Edhazardia aedis USNM 41457]|uniref:Uncharacterized protein n=1 Tax=Edhazardia aedis (strain USNM 41457) TaxID=1003232 RepID=J9D7E8_EDHAE|nr:hypothetical protein EDEG_01998 [Edhazardia aedis USNM 41457]|eukprot:EJW03706.1 hypothetical protein EDEG_01998 [Edhazardia aedis USNM 41457]
MKKMSLMFIFVDATNYEFSRKHINSCDTKSERSYETGEKIRNIEFYARNSINEHADPESYLSHSDHSSGIAKISRNCNDSQNINKMEENETLSFQETEPMNDQIHKKDTNITQSSFDATFKHPGPVINTNKNHVDRDQEKLKIDRKSCTGFFFAQN